MARIVPLPLRFVDPRWTAEVPSPPHDALDPQARRDHLRRHPRSYLAVTRSRDDVEPGASTDPADLLRAGRAALESLLADGVFGPTAPPGYHLYRLEHRGHRQTGLLAGVAVDDYDQGVVRVHEQVNRDRARHLANHLDVVGVQSAPIALAFDGTGRAAAVVDLLHEIAGTSSPVLDFIDADGLRQQLWSVTEPEHRARFETVLRPAPLYLIDGHHRAAAASEYRRGAATREIAQGGGRAAVADWMLAVLFPLAELWSQAFHRVVAGIDIEVLEDAITRRYPVRVTNDPAVVADRSEHELAMATWSGLEPGADRPRWLLFDVPPVDPHSPVGAIDPVRLSHGVLLPLLGIDEASPDRRLRYRPGLADAAALAGMTIGEGEVVFPMRPITNATLVETSERGLVLPPKSTYFQPKVRSGIVLRDLA